MRRSNRMILAELAGQVKKLSSEVAELRRQLASVDSAAAKDRARAPKAASALTRDNFAQVEDLLALYRSIDPAEPLPRMRDWAAGPELQRFLYDEVMRRDRAQVLECGSGTSTVILAYALRKLGAGRVVALDHDPHYAAQTRRELSDRGLSEWAEVVDAPLCEVEIDDKTWLWYDPAALPEGEVDLLLVDGPPGTIGPQARYPALPMLADRLSADALIVLDDAKRADERSVVARWTTEHPRFESQDLRHERGTTILRAKASD